MESFDLYAKKSAKDDIESVKKDVVVAFGKEKIEAVLAANQLLADAISEIVNAQSPPPFATIQRAAIAMGTLALAMPTEFNLDLAKALQSRVADETKHENSPNAKWLDNPRMTRQVMLETAHRTGIGIEAIAVCCGMFLRDDLPIRPGPWTPDESLAVIRELHAPIQQRLKEQSDLLARNATIGIKSEHANRKSIRKRRKKREMRVERCQGIADDLWTEDPGAFNEHIAGLVAIKYREKYPQDRNKKGKSLSAATINDWFKKGILISRRKKSSQKRSS